jgi:hypothetical protein
MTASTPSDLSASAVINLIEAGAYSRDVVLTVARGFLPLPQDDLIAVLSYLIATDDAEIQDLARASLSDIPSRSVHSFAGNEDADPQHLELLLRATRDSTVLELLIRNRAVSDQAIARLAEHAEPAVQEIIVINQSRILRAPGILDALLSNPNLSPDARRRVLETREEFFDKRARAEKLMQEIAALGSDTDETPIADVPLDAIADLLEKADLEDGAGPINAGDTPDAAATGDRQQAIWSRVIHMTVAEKVQLAFRGDRTIRLLLVRDRNRLVCSATMRNPRMTETEVESIAGMRNVEEEVLRLIGNRRDWSSKYNIAMALCKNPKAPIGVVLPLINRLTLRDLKGLKDDKGVPEVVRATARKFYQAKTQKS